MYQKILIANRGEIAVRIIRACREMGIATVAVCSAADKEALHSRIADECICIGPGRVKDSYLNMEQILSAAVTTGAQAIHPGFGFLSENTKFARMCQQCGIDFIGPSVDSIQRMGDKAQARKTMMDAGVPVIPGTKEALTNAEEGKKCADAIGYPVIIKAAAGGGGKGMRVAKKEADFIDLFLLAQQETRQAFGDDKMYIEKYLEQARHIEFQILADKYGNTIHLGERDCSIQRRHQKLVEETPAPMLTQELRMQMGKAAVRAARAAGYYSAGTIEFLVDKEQNFYFMEMNTRIQVEHPVTEMVTGIDLIKEMIRISADERLNCQQSDIINKGCSIECRITAEDTERGFMPCCGQVTMLHFPGGNGIRVDSALFQGCQILPFYDSMLAKIIVHGTDRREAIAKMAGALKECVIEGITTNLVFQRQLMDDQKFIDGDAEGINLALEERYHSAC